MQAGTGAPPTGHSGRYSKVEDCGRAMLSLRGDAPIGHYLLGIAALDEHRFEAAVEHAMRVVALQADHVDAWLLASDGYLELGQLEAAHDAVNRALDERPTTPALVRAAHLQWLDGRSANAKRLYLMAIRNSYAAGDRATASWIIDEAAQLFEHDGRHDAANYGHQLAASVAPKAPSGP